MTGKWRNDGVTNLFLCGIVLRQREVWTFWNRCILLSQIFDCTDNRNIRADGLYKDGLHVLDKGKIVLVNNFVISLN